jgi:probable DNA repair protein
MPVPEEINRAFASGTTILAANMRAARWLQREYATEQTRLGRRAWATPPIYDWATWVRSRWHDCALSEPDAPLLLTSLQERRVWTRMQGKDAALVVSPARMAALAESGYALLSAYEAHAARSQSWLKSDAERFRQWAARFDRECARHNWIAAAGLESRVAARLTKPEAGEMLLAGFERTTPAQATLLNALAAWGVNIRYLQDGVTARQMKFVQTPGMREEIAACAQWARALLDESPQARIGVLIPDLSAMRTEMERIFRRVLAPELDEIGATDAPPFEFSLGQALAHVPVVHAALLLLRWFSAPLREEEVSWLLLSGYLGAGGSEYHALAKLDARNRATGSLSLEITLPDFLRRAGVTGLATLAGLLAALRSAAANRINEEERLPGRWVDLVQLLLREASWPGAAHGDTMHFQALRRWEHALDEIALLDFDGQRLGYSDFLKTLQAHTLETIFSPESQGAPVQIMGTLEAAGQEFDAVWFLGADDASWPPRGRPHPLLPKDVQSRLKMPYADAENDLELAMAVTARIAASAPTVVFSYAERNRDGELRPSPLLPRNAEWRSAPSVPEAVEVPPWEEIDEGGERVPWPQDRPAGGSEVLKQQAACPFQAFATKRLRAEPLNRSEWGLSAAERGKLLHKVLEKIWSPSQGALHSLEDLRHAMREGRLRGILSEAIAEVFEQFAFVDDAWMLAYLASEQRRLLHRLEEWMKVEAKRVPFTVIACEEKLEDVSVGGLKLKLRADRVDRVGAAGTLILDYKSGEVSPHDWEGLRPNEPQLPLYAVFGNLEDVRGVLFARIRAGEDCLTGRVADVKTQLFADAKPHSAMARHRYTEFMRDEWNEALLALAGDFLAGDAAVDPKQGKKTCQYCPLPGLCRVSEIEGAMGGHSEEEGHGAD